MAAAACESGFMKDNRIERIVIVGGGTAGWMAAAALGRFLAHGNTRLCLVESAEIGTIGVGEATIPPIRTFNGILGIDEAEFLQATGGTYKLGIEFVDWGALGRRYFHPFGRYGRDIAGVDFHQLYLRERTKRALPDIEAFCVGAMAARAGRFGRPASDPAHPEHDFNYAFHFDASLYALFLRRFAERLGVERLEGKVVDVEMEPARGFVQAIRLADGRRIEGELFVDCSGFRGLLIEEALATGYEDWSRWLPCDRAIAVPSANNGAPEPYTRSTARGAGWQWRIPLQHRTGNGHVYASAFLEADRAERILLEHLPGEALAPPRHLSFVTGRRKLAWNRNVIALGLAAGFVEPLESTSIHLIQAGIARLLALFPDRRFAALERDEYNRSLRTTFENVRDFVTLHYKLTARTDTPFWIYCRDMDIPDTLEQRLALFRGRGRNLRMEGELFGLTSWVAVMLGQNLWPEDYDPAVDALDEHKITQLLRQIQHSMVQVAAAMPAHLDFIRQTGGLARATRPPQTSDTG
jgi:tryptophan 7-halogenase